MNEKKDLALNGLGAGLVCGLVALGAPKRGWRFRDTYAHAAIEELYRHLEQQPTLTLRFAIYLDPIYGKSPVWEGLVDDLMMYGWLSQSIPDGEFTIHASKFLQRFWLDGEEPRSAGGRELWLDCARRFQEAYCRGSRAALH